MTRIRKSLFLAFAAVLLFGVCGHTVLAAGHPAIDYVIVSTPAGSADTGPDKGSGLFGGNVAFGPNPPDTTGPSWPCFAGSANTDCASISAGGLVVGSPLKLVSHTCSSCGQIYATVQTTTASGAATVTITVLQGTTTIFTGSQNIANVPKGSTVAVWVNGVTFTGGRVGKATIEVATTVGTATIKAVGKIGLN